MAASEKVLAIGNATIDAFLTIHDLNNECRIDEGTRDFCVKFGEKIDVDRCDFAVGGNAANIAVGLSRLGIQTGLVAEIGDDELSAKIINTLEKESVDRTFVEQKHHMPTSFTVGMNFQNDRTLFVQHVKREHDFSFEKMKDTTLFFLTSLGHDWQTSYKRLLEHLEMHPAILAFNPGSLQLHEGADTVRRVLKKTDILFVNKEEAEQLLFGEEPKRKNNTEVYIQSLMRQCQELGAKIVVITNGGHGSYVRDENGKHYSAGIQNSKVVERTGAGDSYTSGFLAAWMRGLSIPEAMLWGSLNASAVVGKIGAQAGLLTKAQMEDYIASRSLQHALM